VYDLQILRSRQLIAMGKNPLDVARGHIGRKEDGPNRGAIVRASLAGRMRDGRPLGIREGVLWCSAHVARSERPQAESRGLAIFKRNGSDPRFGAEGHVERIERCNASMVTTIGGNVGGQVVRHAVSLDNPDLVGWIMRHESALTNEERALVEANASTSIKRFVGATLEA
jgi:hypothetical protein